MEPEERRRRLSEVQQKLQVLWDKAEAAKDAFTKALLWAEYENLEAQERELLRPGSRKRMPRK